MSGAVPEPLVEVIPPWNRRIRKIATWLVGLALFWVPVPDPGRQRQRLVIVASAIVAIVMLGRAFWRPLKKLWAQAKEGGVILTTRRRYISRVFLPSHLGWLCRASSSPFSSSAGSSAGRAGSNSSAPPTPTPKPEAPS